MKTHPLVKLLQSQGLGSKKACEKIFWESQIFCNGQPFEPETGHFNYGDTLLIDGKELLIERDLYIALNKPEGYETSHKPTHHPSVFDLLPNHFVERGIQAVGRLDVDTTGLLLFSTDGQFIHKLSSGKKRADKLVPKVYEITLADEATDQQISSLLKGVVLHDDPEPVLATEVTVVTSKRILMTITTGKYHQVKRMIAATGNKVDSLHRQSMGPYHLPERLVAGNWTRIAGDLI